MEEIIIRCSDRSYKFKGDITIFAIINEINPDNKENIVACNFNGNIIDLSCKINEDGDLSFVLLSSEEGLEILRHSASHIMALTIQELYPKTLFAIGPAISTGFYYDIDSNHTFNMEGLPEIKEKMKKFIKENLPFKRKEISRIEAINFFKSKGDIYKVEILNEIEDEKVSLYETGNFIDLCRGPHIPSTSYLKHFELLSVAGAYWRGDEKNKMLQRIYGTAFPTEEELFDFIRKREEAKKRDHRKLGIELDLFSVHEEAGSGLIFWHPKGSIIRKTIEDFWREEHLKKGYEFLYTPHIAKIDLWKISGHWDYYRENMYSPMDVDEDQYMVKPMNCPFHIMIYKSEIRSYRDLPLRWAELGTVYRYEKAGVLHGLLRVRGFTQDDAHLFVKNDQLEDEIVKLIDFTKYMIESFGFKKYNVYLSTRPEKYVGMLSNWEVATNSLEKALKDLNINYTVDPGEGVFYGPKIDFKLVDAIGREWQGPTIQVDFNLPERFDLSYIAEDGKPKRPIMIHRVVLGSMERFFGTLIEHYAGAFPVWLSPIQAVVVPITDAHLEYANSIKDELQKEGIRIKVDSRKEKMNSKIRDWEMQKVPYILVVGNKEIENKSVSVRKRQKGDLGGIQKEEFKEIILKEIKEKII